MTTSLGHRYLDDLAETDDGTLIIRSLTAKDRNPHLPMDKSELMITMTEATDDSYIFAMKFQTLTHFCLEMEWFQYAYGWITQWLKTKLFILCTAGQIPDYLEMESIMLEEGVHPWMASRHRAPVISGELEFLCTKVDNPGAHF